jgi:two-component system, OmpR family, sensor histidine kinase TctE
LNGAAIPVESGSPSLTGRLLRGMIVPMAGIAILLGVGGSWAIEESVEAVNDRILSAASRAIAEALAVEDGEISLDLPPSAFAMLENAERDNVYYSIAYQGSVISGYPDLPIISPMPMRDGELKFGKAQFRGKSIRIVAEVRRLPRIDGLVTVQVAETMSARDRVFRQMLLSLALLEAVLIAVSAILIPVAVRWGLAPLRQLQEAMDRQRAPDFTPLPTARAPVELRELVGAFNSLLGRLDAAVQGMRRFTADASHQMRTPLSILRTHVSVLRKAMAGSDDAEASLEDIEQATSRLQNLLVQLLALARADSAAPMDEARARSPTNTRQWR